jgi:hypothetical protein
MLVIKELVLHDDITIQVTIKDYYLVTDVFLIFRGIVRDKEREHRFKLEEPYGRFINNVLDCKEYGTEVRK